VTATVANAGKSVIVGSRVEGINLFGPTSLTCVSGEIEIGKNVG